jgi:hypothetical protein
MNCGCQRAAGIGSRNRIVFAADNERGRSLDLSEPMIKIVPAKRSQLLKQDRRIVSQVTSDESPDLHGQGVNIVVTEIFNWLEQLKKGTPPHAPGTKPGPQAHPENARRKPGAVRSTGERTEQCEAAHARRNIQREF